MLADELQSGKQFEYRTKANAIDLHNLKPNWVKEGQRGGGAELGMKQILFDADLNIANCPVIASCVYSMNGS